MDVGLIRLSASSRQVGVMTKNQESAEKLVAMRDEFLGDLEGMDLLAEGDCKGLTVHSDLEDLSSRHMDAMNVVVCVQAKEGPDSEAAGLLSVITASRACVIPAIRLLVPKRAFTEHLSDMSKIARLISIDSLEPHGLSIWFPSFPQ